MRFDGLFAICLVLLVAAAIIPARAEVGEFAVIGDTQRALFWERYFLFREDGREITPVLWKDLAARRPEFVVHLGDIVAWGSEGHWAEFDRQTAPLRLAGIPLFPILGNHDVNGSSEYPLDRFPQLSTRRWYLKTWNQLRLIFLDGNESTYSKARWQEQIQWFQEQLTEADRDRTVQSILVFIHFPPYTNSTVTGDEVFVQRDFVPAFKKSAKTRALFSGHAHTYEHFLKDGKHFVVSGGAGGPRVTLLRGREQRHSDLYSGPIPRPWHYLLLRPVPSGLDIRVQGMNTGETATRTIDQFVIRNP